ncbi:recombinase family protein [Candidatus Kapabacteria bacterium]|nr:recombinase family protein [Candidatus Kapabacteria bacterium]
MSEREIPDDPHGARDNDIYLVVDIKYKSANLWQSTYSETQQMLFDLICNKYDEGMSYNAIADWLNAKGYKTPRGNKFMGTHTHSIRTKKLKSIERFSRTFKPEITDIAVQVL